MEKYLSNEFSPRERAEDLIARMSIEEKFAQLQGEFMENIGTKREFPQGVGSVSCLAASIWENRQKVVDKIREIQEYVLKNSEHHIPAFFHIETATGVLMQEATTFPNELGQAATWNPDLEKQIGRVIGRQARACGITHGLAPVLDISRDPRMGRQGETFGEDPTLAAAMGVAYVSGIQNDGDLENGIMACSKHFLGFMNSMGGIHAARSLATPRELREVYGKPFQAAISKADLRSAMNSYSVVDGMPVAGNKELLTEMLRGEMGFNGIVAADYCSIGQLHTLYKLRESLALAGEMAIDAGMDCELPTVETFNAELLERFKSGQADIAVLNQSVFRILEEKFRLGLFENPYPKSDEEIKALVKTEEDEAISLQSARESMVLLKNNGVLPIKEKKKIAVIGWHGNTTRPFFGCYTNFARQESRLGAKITMAGTDNTEKIEIESVEEKYPGSNVVLEHPDTDKLARECYPGMVSIYEELKHRLPETEIVYSYGYPFTGNDTSHFAEALEAAGDADLVIVTLGGRYGWTTGCTTGEGIDSMNINLPVCQELFLRELAKLGKPTVGLHFDGRPCSSDAADETLDALLECFTPGVHGQEAVADILVGNYNPSGKLPVSIAYEGAQVPVYYAYERGSSQGQSESICFPDYVDGPHAPRYAFGHGLSYSSFEFSSIGTDKREYHPTDVIRVFFTVKNTGTMDGAYTPQLYAADEYASMIRPNMELIGFQKVFLKAGESKEVTLTVDPSQFAFLDRDMKWKIEAGEFTLKLGHASNRIDLTVSVKITEDLYIDGKTRAFYAR
ncbi:MAG: glycoside hydrolase family 3 N-terminal domain-containing protein [Eubacteriales bacterium]|nr:glycoside hydrolase family 3 N-terminal domain-containing protein [Eubacteriales bacterium]